jgi:glutathione peroxidase
MKTFALLVAFSLMTNIAVRAGTIYDIPVKDIDGKATDLSAYKGKVVLIVNVASQCGFTPQYTALEATYKKYSGQGFVILGFPCNQFGEQEPGSDAEIKQFCTSKFSVTFPMFDKIEVNGDNRHPLYELLAGKDSPFPGDCGEIISDQNPAGFDFLVQRRKRNFVEQFSFGQNSDHRGVVGAKGFFREVKRETFARARAG